MEQKWIPIEEQIPKEDEYILLSFENFSIPVIGRFEDGAFYAGDEDESLVKQDMYVNAWMPLPKPYRGEQPKQTNADRIRSMTDEELAVNMMCPNENGLAEIECDKSDSCNCYECLLNWLRAER